MQWYFRAFSPRQRNGEPDARHGWIPHKSSPLHPHLAATCHHAAPPLPATHTSHARGQATLYTLRGCTVCPCASCLPQPASPKYSWHAPPQGSYSPGQQRARAQQCLRHSPESHFFKVLLRLYCGSSRCPAPAAFRHCCCQNRFRCCCCARQVFAAAPRVTAGA